MPSSGDGRPQDVELMPSIKRVIDYSALDYHSVLDLPFDVFLQMLKNSVVDELNKSEEGRNYLADCERLNTANIDKVAFRKRETVTR